MPIFDYQCEACGHHFDILQKAGEGVLRKCPECGKLKLRKLLSAPSFHLKGGGWYKSPPSEAKSASRPRTSPTAVPRRKVTTSTATRATTTATVMVPAATRTATAKAATNTEFLALIFGH